MATVHGKHIYRPNTVVFRFGSQPETLTATYTNDDGDIRHFLFPDGFFFKLSDVLSFGWKYIIVPTEKRLYEVKMKPKGDGKNPDQYFAPIHIRQMETLDGLYVFRK